MHDTHNPKVSIIIPVYNGSNYLGQAINSALSQTYFNLEVIVINDGSKDGGLTEQIALSYGDKLKYFYKENGGVASALNFGISKMTGDYFSWLSHDDMYSPEKVEKQIYSLLQCDENSISFCDFIVIDGNGKSIKECNLSNKSSISMRCFLALDVTTGLHGCSLLINKKLFDVYGNFNESLKCTQDYDLWVRFAVKAKFVHVKDKLVYSRQHPEQDSKTKTDLCTKEADILHSKILDCIHDNEFIAYFNGDLPEALSIHKIFMASGYFSTSASLLRIICRNITNADQALGWLKGSIFVGNNKELECFTNELFNYLSCKKKKPTVLFYNNVWFKGGVERVLSVITKHLVHNFDIVLLSLEENNGFELHSDILHLNIGNDSNYFNRVVDIVTVLNPDIFVGNPNIYVDFLDIYGILAARRIKSIACNHAYYFLPMWSSWLYPLLIQRDAAYEKADVVTWLTDFSAQVYSLSHSNCALMPNPLTYDSFNLDDEARVGNEKIILCVGRFYDNIKRLDRALKVFSEVIKTYPDASLHLVGGYNLDISTDAESKITIRELIQSIGLYKAKIKFYGEQENVEQYYKSATVLIMTSDMEGFGMVLVEAGSYGVPSVIFDVPGLEDIISDGENGYIVPQNDIKEMSKYVCTILLDNELHNKLSNKSITLAQRFEQKNIAERWVKLLNLMISTTDKLKLNEELAYNFMKHDTDYKLLSVKLSKIYQQYLCNFINLTTSNATGDSATSCSKSLWQNLNIDRANITNCICIVYKAIFKTAKYLRQNGIKKTIMEINNKLHI